MNKREVIRLLVLVVRTGYSEEIAKRARPHIVHLVHLLW